MATNKGNKVAHWMAANGIGLLRISIGIIFF